MTSLPTTVQNVQKATFEFVSAEKVLPFAVQLVASVVVLIATNVNVPSAVQNWAYANAAACVALFFSLTGIILLKMREPFDAKLFVMSDFDVTVGHLLSAFLFVWWSVAAGILTFQNPFTGTGNGYFATWTGFIASVAGLGMSAERVASAVAGASPLLGWLAASVVLLCSLPDFICRNCPHQGEAIYALVVAILSIITAILFLALEYAGKADSVALAKMYVLLMFSVMWIVAACATTFVYPFVYTGNGYFSVWIGVVLTIRAALPTAAEQEVRASRRHTPTAEKDKDKPAMVVGTMAESSTHARASTDAV